MYGPVNVRADFMYGPVYVLAGLCTGWLMYGPVHVRASLCTGWPACIGVRPGL